MQPASPRQISPEEFEPASFDRNGKYRLGLRIDASVTLPLLLLRGLYAGPTLVVSASVHGDEYEGVRAIYEVFNELDSGGMAGDLLAAPVVNPPAFRSGTRVSPVDGLNLARVFPGSADGSVSERIAWNFSNCVLQRAQFYLDLHSGGIRFVMPSMVGYYSEDPRGKAAAEIFGAPVIWGHEAVDAGRTISFAQERGIPWLYTEARGAGRIAPDDLRMMKRGIYNLMRFLGILPDAPELRTIGLRLQGSGNTDDGIAAAKAGFLMTEVTLLEPVSRGQLLGRLVDGYGLVIEEYTAPTAGIMALIHEFPVVEAGDSLFLIAQEQASAGRA